MENDYVRWPRRTGGSGGGVTTLNGLSGAVVLAAGSGITLTPVSNTITISATGSGSGTVTSVGLALPSIFAVTGSPVTGAGTLTGSLNTQSANLVFAGPASGGAAIPTFRALVPADINLSSQVSGVLPIANGGTNSSTALNNNRVMVSSAGSIVEAAAITPNRALISDSNGLPTQSVTTSAELAFVSGVTSSIQTQLNGKQASGNYITDLTGDVTASGPGSAVATIANLAVTNAKIANATIDLTTKVTGVLPIANGGTGQSSALAAFNALSPLTTAGDLLTYSAGNNVRLPVGSNGDVLTVSGGVPVWAASGNAGYISFSFANNQSSPADVTGFLVDHTVNNGFEAEVSIIRSASAIVGYADGSPNTVFDGNLGTSFTGGGVINAIGVQSTGNAIVGGNFVTFNGETAYCLLSLNADGTKDNAFSALYGQGLNNTVTCLGIQSDDQIVVGGNFTTWDSLTSIIRFARIKADGSFDFSFATNLGSGFSNQVECTFVQANGQILVGGEFTTFNGNSRNYLVRLNADGTEDTTFYGNLGTGFNSFVLAVYEQANSQILVAGQFTDLNGTSVNRLIRLNSDGTIDTTFVTNIGTGLNAAGRVLREDAANKILVGGQFTDLNGNTRNHLVRLNSDGTEDASFYTNLGTAFNNSVSAVDIQTDNSILIGGGFTSFNGNTRNRLVRVDNTGVEDTTFYTTMGTAYNNSVSAIKILTDQSALIGGSYSSFNGASLHALMELATTAAPAFDAIKQQTLRGMYRSSATSWEIGAEEGLGDDTGLTFSMTSLGQLQYVSTNLTGTIGTHELRFIVTGL